MTDETVSLHTQDYEKCHSSTCSTNLIPAYMAGMSIPSATFKASPLESHILVIKVSPHIMCKPSHKNKEQAVI